MNAIGTVVVKNSPRNLEKYQVARVVDGELWHYGSFPTYERAKACADEIGNAIIVTH